MNFLRNPRQILPLLLLAFPLADARADSLCDYYRKYNPGIHKVLCKNGQATSKPAGASSTFSSAFNLNSGSLPTEPSSYGLEFLGHRIRGDGELNPTFSLVKGFRKFGTGISTGSANTFYGDDILQRLYGETPSVSSFDSREPERGRLSNFNFGTAINLLDPKRGPKLRLGLSARYNLITDTWGGGPGLMLTTTHFGAGVGVSRERISNFLPRIQFVSWQFSARWKGLEAEYSILTNNLSSDVPEFELRPIHILTGTLSLKRLILTAAVRQLNYVGSGVSEVVTQRHYAIQYLFSKNFSAGILFNYVPGSNTLGLQYYL